jgi:hypothetical protein
VTPAPPAPPAPDAAPAVDTLPDVKLAFEKVSAADDEAKHATQAFQAIAEELATAIAAPAHDDTVVTQVGGLKNNLGDALAHLDQVAAKVDTEARAVSGAAGATSSPDAAKFVDEAKARALAASRVATVAHARAAAAMKKADDYVKTETGESGIFIAAADTAIVSGDFADAQQKLDKAAKLIHKSGAKNADLDYSYAQLYDKKAGRTTDPAAKRKLLQQAGVAYQRFAKAGAGPRVLRANDRLTEITDEIKELDQP